MSPSAVKTAHYEHQLYEALLKGAWGDASPGRAYNGDILTWSELLRKFRKHVPNHPELANVASQTQALALLLLPVGDSTASGGSISPEVLDGDVSDPTMPLRLGSECVLLKERREEALGCLNALGSANENSISKTSIQLARAHYAYALGNPSECLSILSQVDFSPLSSSLPTPQGSISRSTRTSTTVSTALTTITNATIESVLSRSASVTESSGSDSATTRNLPGRKAGSESSLSVVWHATELLRGRCEEGMSHELLKDVVSASLAYDAGLVILDALTSTKSFGKSERVKVETFRSHREMWRWAELLIRRRSILAAKFQPLCDTFIHFRAYQLYSSNWPLSFRPGGFGAIYSLYIRALCLSSPLSSASNQSNAAPLQYSSSFLSVSKSHSYLAPKRVASSSKFPISEMNWYVETRRAGEEYQRVLGSVTRFPKAGETNSAINSFVDLCVAVWERGGCSETETEWVIELLWWATRLTFHSQRIMRHLTRLLLASGNFAEAKRTFQLYVQLVIKSRQTSQGEVSLLLKRRPMDLPAEHPDTLAREEKEEEEAVANGKKLKAKEVLANRSSGDIDDDKNYLDALIYGVRMLCRYGNRDDVAEARRICDLVDGVITERRKWPSLTLAYVSIVRGVLFWREANLEHNPHARPALLKQAKAALQNATTFKACPASAHFQLAIVEAAQLSINSAILSAQQALELAPKDRRAWHLLALLLTAKEEWFNAKQLIDICFDETPESDFHDATPPQTMDFPINRMQDDGTGAQEYVTPGPEGDGGAGVLIEPRSDQIPHPYTLLADMSITPPTSRQEHFEVSISLLLTQIAIVEKLEGADSANEKLQDLFAYFSSHCPSRTAASSRRESLDVSQLGAYTQSHNAAGSVPRIEVNEPQTPTTAHPGPGSSVSESHSHRHRSLLHSRKKSDSGEWVEVEPALEMHASVPDLQSQPEKQEVKSLIGSLTPSRVRSRSPGSSLHGYGSLPHDLQRSLTPSPVPTPTPVQRKAHENRLLSDVWLTSAAVFRRMRRFDQAKDAIGEAEMLDENNPGVWIQLGLYYMAVGPRSSSLESFSKALMLDLNNISATLHLARVYLDPHIPPVVATLSSSIPPTVIPHDENEGDEQQPGTQKRDASDIDMAAGLLEDAARRTIGFDVPEVWYFLAQAVGLQGRKEKQRACLIEALRLEEGRTVRALKSALPVCL